MNALISEVSQDVIISEALEVEVAVWFFCPIKSIEMSSKINEMSIMLFVEDVRSVVEI